jgi:ABC-type multidrug transport system ATPase subunit
VNGKKRNLARFRHLSSYIMQEDILLPHLTVREAMKYAALLKLPRDTSREQMNLIVMIVINFSIKSNLLKLISLTSVLYD